jgi:uncharacterized OB-fold protein
MEASSLISEIQKALFQWYDFSKDAKIYTYTQNTVEEQQGKKFDYIVSKADLETHKNPLIF